MIDKGSSVVSYYYYAVKNKDGFAQNQ